MVLMHNCILQGAAQIVPIAMDQVPILTWKEGDFCRNPITKIAFRMNGKGDNSKLELCVDPFT